MSFGALFPLPLGGYTFVQSAKAAVGGANSVTVTLSSAPASGDLVVAIMGANRAPVTPTSTSATWTQAVVDTGLGDLGIYYSTNVTTTAITASWGGATNGAMYVLHATGAAASPLDQTNASSVNTSSDPGSITPVQSGEFIVSAVFLNTSPSISATPSGYTALASQADGAQYLVDVAYLIQTSAAATDPAWTTSASFKAAAVASFKHA